MEIILGLGKLGKCHCEAQLISQTVQWFKEQSCLKREILGWASKISLLFCVQCRGIIVSVIIHYSVQQLWLRLADKGRSKAGLVNELLFPSLCSSVYNGLIDQSVQVGKTFRKDQIRRRLGF